MKLYGLLASYFFQILILLITYVSYRDEVEVLMKGYLATKAMRQTAVFSVLIVLAVVAAIPVYNQAKVEKRKMKDEN